MGLIRQVLWFPDGKPPESWSEAREVSVLKRLLMHRNVAQLESAIIGLAHLRETGQIAWLKAGEKITTRALYCTRSGVSQMFELATRAYWQSAKRPRKQAAQAVGDILFSVLQHSSKYREYLKSPEWRARRERALVAAAYRCQRCHHCGGGLDVHHLRYDHFGAELDEDLEVVCRDCHNVLHGRVSQPRPGAPF